MAFRLVSAPPEEIDPVSAGDRSSRILVENEARAFFE
jgi:hypothetical protein